MQHIRPASNTSATAASNPLWAWHICPWAFTVAGPSVWNLLPDYLRDPAVYRDTFKDVFIRMLLMHAAH